MIIDASKEVLQIGGIISGVGLGEVFFDVLDEDFPEFGAGVFRVGLVALVEEDVDQRVRVDLLDKTIESLKMV